MDNLIKQLKFNRQQKRFFIKLKNELSKIGVYLIDENYYYWIKTFLNYSPIIKTEFRKKLAICMTKHHSDGIFSKKLLNSKHYYNKYITKTIQ